MTVEGADRFSRDMRATATRARQQGLATHRRFGMLLQGRVRANMSGRSGVVYTPEAVAAATLTEDGRPVTQFSGRAGQVGPRVQTGDTRRSVSNPQTTALGDVLTTVVDAQGGHLRRLELGFVGVDSLGRHYNQPPYPAWRPAVQALAPEFAAAMAAIARPGGAA